MTTLASDNIKIALTTALGLSVVAWAWRVILRKQHIVVAESGGASVLQSTPLSGRAIAGYSGLLVLSLGILSWYLTPHNRLIDLPQALLLACVPIVVAEDVAFGTIGLPMAILAIALPLLALPAGTTPHTILSMRVPEAAITIVLARYAMNISRFDQAYCAVVILTCGTPGIIATIIAVSAVLSKRTLPLAAFLGGATLMTTALLPNLL
jgi:hypothetical protein